MPNTADTAGHSARSLLKVLSDDQLARYGEIARDQASAELSRWWLQALMGLAAIGVLGWAAATWGITGIETAGIEAEGFDRSVALALGIGWLLAYFPYRRVKNWVLWNQHCKAVEAEQSRRNGETGLSGNSAQQGRG